MVARWLLPILMVAMLTLAGCVSDEETTERALDGDEGGDGTDGAEDTSAGALGSLRFPFPDDATNTTLWANGSYEVSQSRFPVGMTTEEATEDQPWQTRIDITDDVPRGGPVLVVAEVNAETTKGDWPVGGDVDLWLETASENWISGEFDAPYGGYTRFEVLVWRATDDPIEVVLQYDESDSSGSFDYTLRVDLLSNPTLLPLDTPVAAALGTGSTATVTAEEGTMDLLVWDPDDTFLGRFSGGEVVLETSENATAGDHVLMATGEASGFRVRTSEADGAAEPGLRMLGTAWEDHEWHRIEPDTQLTWDFEADRMPLRARIEISNHEDHFTCMEMHGRLDAPGGEEIIARDWDEPGCSGIGGIRIGWWSDFADPALASGTYTGTMENSNTMNLQVRGGFLHYVR